MKSSKGMQQEDRMETRNIRQQVTFKSPPHEVYELLMDEKKHGTFSHSKTSISRKVGGKISSGDGYIEGTNLELVPDKKIVQSWRDSDWAVGHFSKATWSFSPTTGGTLMVFTQSGVPADQYEATSQGWRDYYWEPMKGMLKK
jgi:activator of HSP90 ATPase